jgi:hypothetical protein
MKCYTYREIIQWSLRILYMSWDLKILYFMLKVLYSEKVHTIVSVYQYLFFSLYRKYQKQLVKENHRL